MVGGVESVGRQLFYVCFQQAPWLGLAQTLRQIQQGLRTDGKNTHYMGPEMGQHQNNQMMGFAVSYTIRSSFLHYYSKPVLKHSEMHELHMCLCVY